MTTAAAPPANDVTRSYVTLSFLQWLPVGLSIVPLVLLILERGFTLADVAVVVAVYSVTVAVLELPTGGLADVIGRRPVLAASALAHAIGLVVLALASSLALLAASSVFRGIARALSSGPLEAWFVDAHRAVRGAEDRAGLTAGLARGEVAGSVGIGVGTLLGGALPLLDGALSVPGAALAIPVLLAAGIELVRFALASRLPESGPRAGSALSAVRAVPSTIRGAFGLVRRDSLVLRLLLVAGATGVTFAVLELVMPAWLDGIDGGLSPALAYGVLVTAGFGADALGAALGPVARGRFSTPSRAAVATLAFGLASCVALAATSRLSGSVGLVLAGAALLGVFVGVGAAGPVLGELLHDRVPDDHRATMLSAQSLLLQIAGAGGAVLAGWLTTAYSPALGFLVAAGGLALAAALLLTARAELLVEPQPEPRTGV